MWRRLLREEFKLSAVGGEETLGASVNVNGGVEDFAEGSVRVVVIAPREEYLRLCGFEVYEFTLSKSAWVGG